MAEWIFYIYLYGAVYETHGPYPSRDACELARHRIDVLGPEGPVLTIGPCVEKGKT